jgi:hypothetical protein
MAKAKRKNTHPPSYSPSKEHNTITTPMKQKPRSGGEQPIGTRNSANEAREVKEVVGIGAFYGDRDAMDIDDNK